jgi:hypothetical protein
VTQSWDIITWTFAGYYSTSFISFVELLVYTFFCDRKNLIASFVMYLVCLNNRQTVVV